MIRAARGRASEVILRMMLSGESMAVAPAPSRDVDHSGQFPGQRPTRLRQSPQKKKPRQLAVAGAVARKPLHVVGAFAVFRDVEAFALDFLGGTQADRVLDHQEGDGTDQTGP